MISNFNLSTAKTILASFLAKLANLIVANISDYSVYGRSYNQGPSSTLPLVFITITKYKEELQAIYSKNKPFLVAMATISKTMKHISPPSYTFLNWRQVGLPLQSNFKQGMTTKNLCSKWG